MGSPDAVLSENDSMPPELHQKIRGAVLTGVINKEQAKDLIYSDIIISGDDSRYAVIEVSITATSGDIVRAKARADALGNAIRGETFAAVAAAIIGQPQVILADHLNVAILKVQFKRK